MVVTQKMQDASADLEKAAAEANRVGATPQCFLIDFLDEFIKLRRVMPRGNAEYSGDPANYVCVIPPTETGTTFTSRLNSPNLQYLLEGVPKALMAELQPVVRLYKVMYNPSGPPPPTPPREHKPREEILVPLPLGNFVDPSRAFNYPGHTHSGHLAANLQTFTFDYEGVNPAEVDFFLRCKMSLEFNTPDAFFHEYTLKHNNKIFKASFSDLVKRPVINDNNDHLRYGHDMFRIKIELFYPDPGEHWFGKLAHLTPIHKEKLKQAIAASRATFFLNIIKHEFKFNTEVPSSPFVLDIEYIGSVESSLRTNHTSVISLHDWNFHDEMQEDRDRGEESIIKRYEAKLADLDTMGAGAFTDMERSDVFQMATDGNTAVRHVSTGQAYLNEGQWLGYTSVHGWRKPITEGDLVFEYTPPEVGHTDNSDASEIYSAAFARKIIREGRSTEKEMWAAYNVQYSADRAKIVEDFFEVRQKYMNFLKEIKGDIGELRASAYGKLMRRLWGQSFHAGSLEQDTGRSVAGHRNQMVHQITIPLKSAIAWQAKREQATDAEDKHFKEQWKQAEKEGDKITINRLKLERSRKQLSTKNFYKNFWRQHVFSSLATEAENMRSLADQTRQAGEGQTLRGSTREERKKLEGEGHGAALRAAGSGGQGTIQGYTLARASKSGNHLDLTKEQWEKLLKVKNNAPGTAFHHLRTTIKEGETVATDVLTSGTWAVEFVYFGDLVNSVIDLARGNASWREVELDLFTSWNGGGSSSNTIKKRGRLHVVLGTLTYKDWVTGKQKIVSLDEIPIELGLIQEFWIKHVVKPFKDNYPLRQCLRDMMTDLIANVISGTCRSPGEPTSKIMPVLEHISVASKAPMQIVINPRMTQEMREVVGEDLASAMDAGDLSIPARHAQREQYLEAEARGDVAKMDEINQKRDAIRRQVGTSYQSAGSIDSLLRNETRIVAQKPKTSPGTKDTFGMLSREYIIMHAAQVNPEHLRGIKGEDNQQGIVHINVGREGVPVKDISFTKTDIPFYLETKGETAGLKANTLELSEPYSVDIRLQGHTMWKPGMHIYLTVPHFGPPNAPGSRAHRLGLGGYFMTNKIGNSITALGSRIEWNSDINGLWVSFGHPPSTQRRGVKASPVENNISVTGRQSSAPHWQPPGISTLGTASPALAPPGGGVATTPQQPPIARPTVEQSQAPTEPVFGAEEED